MTSELPRTTEKLLGFAHGQSDFLCPPNNKMGLCEAVPDTCFDDRDCARDHICCPEACTRTCKPKLDPGQSSRMMAEVPDLLNDPRVYIGKCPDSSCFSLFNSEPDQCSTSNLCRREQFCCHDGCKNVCQWKPPYAAIIAKHEARLRYQQQMLYQKQQAEQKKKQEEAYRETQRKRAEMEQARRAAQARAEAAAVLAAQKAKEEYQAQLQAKSAAQAEAVSRLQQKMARQQAASLLQQQQQQPQPSPAQTVSSSSSAASSSSGDGQKSGGNISLNGFFNALKEDKLAGTLTNQINSPANVNPYTVGGGVNSLDKGGHSASHSPSKHTNSASEISAISSALAKLIMPASSRTNQYSPPAMNVAPPTGKIVPPTFNNQAWSRAPASQSVRSYSYQNAQSSSVNNQYSQLQQQPQTLSQKQQQQQHRRQPVSPFLMYHFMQAA
ncbi:hypothetical protein RRG08_067334 [Elysia crispata]|uniref:Uncharacterized protein n=1 Tax=Elysia crispata TaxID=231223 RepID=A0AAE1D8G0_9GAST|nr:hypothetical protein RRG08_067334 [Elysia crispata]